MDEIIGNRAAAEYVHISESTWRAYVTRKDRQHAPPPDRREVRGGHAIPVWRKATLDQWLAGRPGRGRNRKAEHA